MSVELSEKEYLTQSGLAEMLHISVRSVQRLASDRQFPAPIRAGGRMLRWSRGDVEEFLRKRSQSDGK